MDRFLRFPHTPHLAWLGEGEPRDDKVLSHAEARELLSTAVVAEEKLDGANLGFSVSRDGDLRAQNRGQYLSRPFSGQFARLDRWLALHEDALFDALGTHLIAFGEWCAARHSVAYSALPDWWVLFDVYDREAGAFWSTARRDAWAKEVGVLSMPAVFKGPTTVRGLTELMTSRPSRYGAPQMEGVVVRREDPDWLLQRAKLVRADFTQQIEDHWRKRAIEWNRLEVST